MAEIITCPAPAFVVLTSLIGVFFIGLAGNRPNVREFFTFVTGFIKFGLVLAILPAVLHGQVIVYKVLDVFPDMPGMAIQFRADALSMFLALTASGLWLVTSLYSIGYMRAHHEPHQTRFFCSFAIAIAATMGVAFSGSLFTMFLFYELLTISTYPLVVHHEDDEARAGALRYVCYLLGLSVAFFLPAIMLTYHVAGTVEFGDHGILAGSGASSAMVTLIFVLFILGIAKSGIMPVQSWLPSAMVAPTPVSALLHAVAVVKVGVFSVVKVVLYVFGVEFLRGQGAAMILTVMASFTLIVASCIALKQDNLKRRLAYSTISQLSYILLGVSLLSASGITASVIHILFHAFAKITLFFAAGAIFIAAHKKNISELDGLAKQMPWTCAAFAVGAISMVGLPPAVGLISKVFLIFGALEAGQLWVIGVLITSTILNGCYFLPIVHRMFFRPAPADAHGHEAPWQMVVALCIPASLTVIAFFKYNVVLELAELVVETVL